MVQANKLTELLTIKKLTTVSTTATGEPIEVYTTVATVYGSIINQKGNTSFKDGSNYFDGVQMYLRYLPLCKKGLRVEYNGNDYQVENYTHLQRNQATVIDIVGVK